MDDANIAAVTLRERRVASFATRLATTIYFVTALLRLKSEVPMNNDVRRKQRNKQLTTCLLKEEILLS